MYNKGSATLTDCTIVGNDATGSSGGGQGGGISNGLLQSKAVVVVTDSLIADNTAEFGGGGVYNNGTATITDSTIANNFANQGTSLLASNGGGLDNDGTATVVACTISGNTTTASGGGVYNGGLGPSVATLDDTIVAGNTNTGGSASDLAISTNQGVPVTGSYDLIGPGGSGGLTGSTNIFLSSLTGLGLTALGDFGGPTELMALESDSEAIGTGSSAISGVTVPTTDQAGFPLATPPDIGAYQVVSSPLVVDVTTDGVGAPADELDLRAAADIANIATTPTTISFDSTAFGSAKTIILADGPLELTNTNTSAAITIDGSQAGVTISGNAISGVFEVEAGVTATISGLTIARGSAASGGGVYNQGTTQLTDCTVSGNSATGSGGALFNSGTLTLTNCTITGNSAIAGGGLASSGTAALYSCTLERQFRGGGRGD